MNKVLAKTLREHHWAANLQILRWFFEALGYAVTVDNGQRIVRATTPMCYGRNRYEVHVSRIPQHYTEIDVFHLFSLAGLVYELRVMYTYDNVNRGYAYVAYYDASSAKRALRLDRATRDALRVQKSIDNRCLYFGRISHDVQLDKFRALMEGVVDGIEEVTMPLNVCDQSSNRGYAFVNFQCHKAAAIAKRTLAHSTLTIDGRRVAIDWAKPVVDVDEEQMQQITTLYLHNLPLEASHLSVAKHVCSVTERPQAIARVYKKFDYSFVHFNHRCFAEEAFHLLQGTYLWDRPLMVKWAQPVIRKVDNFQRICKKYKSLPFNMKKDILSKAKSDDNNNSSNQTCHI